MKAGIGWWLCLALGFSAGRSVTANPATVSFREVTSETILARVYGEGERLKLCGGEIDRSVSEAYHEVYPLPGNRYLVQFLCFMGAYQGNYEYYLYKSGGNGFSISPVSLEIIENPRTDRKTPVRSIGGLPEYDPRRGILTVHTKYRGLGDCGTWARYRWERNRFRLIEYRVKEKCDGRYIDPDRYSRVYP